MACFSFIFACVFPGFSDVLRVLTSGEGFSRGLEGFSRVLPKHFQGGPRLFQGFAELIMCSRRF